MIQDTRIKTRNDGKITQGDYVLYWMQASQRADYNHALEYAIVRANELKMPLVVFFGITDTFPEANERHYAFMLEGLKEVQEALEKRRILMVIRHQSPEKGAVELAGDAALVVTDRGYLRIQRQWRAYVAQHVACPFVQIESDVVVPAEEVSGKEEYAAATLRPKISKKIEEYLVPLRKRRVTLPSLSKTFRSFDISDTDKALSRLKIDRSVSKVDHFKGGFRDARKKLTDFIAHKLDSYPDKRNDPLRDNLSCMSPYLHFGQISPLDIALKIKETASPGKDASLEELIVRRELSMNFVFYNDRYDSFEGLPEWSRKTLAKHKKDIREYMYSTNEFENARTHDPYWNAAQKEMVLTGKMHGYMRMYWGKKIIEWSKIPEEAFQTALYLNNKYEIDGRDPNGFTGVAWCFGKHDRPWGERALFGNVRYMNANGLRRKFDPDAYVRKVQSVER